MSFEIIKIPAIRPDRIGSYLKGIGLLRVLARHMAPEAPPRAWWDGCMCLAIDGGLEALERVLHPNRYHPDFLICPWNSYGFKELDDRGDMLRVNGVSDELWVKERAATHGCMEELRLLAAKGDAATPKRSGDAKARALAHLRAVLPDAAVEWLDAIAALRSDADGVVAEFSPLGMGAGGSNGQWEYTKNFLNAYRALLAAAAPTETLFASLGVDGGVSATIGAGGSAFFSTTRKDAGSGTACDTPQSINPWDLLLALEGIAGWPSAVSRLCSDADGISGTTFPFAFAPSAVAGPNLVDGTIEKLRWELWTPIWRHPATWDEGAALIRDGRVTARRRIATDSITARVGLAELGVAAGIPSFATYTFIAAANTTTIVPRGEVFTPRRSAPVLDVFCDDAFREWMRRSAVRAQEHETLERAILALTATVSDDHASVALRSDAWRRVVRAIGALEHATSCGRERGKTPPFPYLSHASRDLWGRAMMLDSPEERLALALASLPLERCARLPLDAANARKWSDSAKAHVHARGAAAMQLVEGLEASLVLAQSPSRNPTGRHPLHGSCPASLSDVRVWTELDEHERTAVVQLASGLSAIRPRHVAHRSDMEREIESGELLGPAWLAIRVALDPSSSSPNEPIPLSTLRAIVAQLRSGRLRDAVAVALHRLHVAEIRLRLRRQSLLDACEEHLANPDDFIAALAFPLSRSAFRGLALDTPQPHEEASSTQGAPR